MAAQQEPLFGVPGASTPNPMRIEMPERRKIIVNETITAESFVQEHQVWLNKLLEPSPPLPQLLPLIFRHITKDTIRFLPGPYNDKLHGIFLQMGDRERCMWCVQSPVPLGLVGREIPISTTFDLRKIAQISSRIWQIGHFLNSNGIIHGVELQRMSWQLEALLAVAQGGNGDPPSESPKPLPITVMCTKEQRLRTVILNQKS